MESGSSMMRPGGVNVTETTSGSAFGTVQHHQGGGSKVIFAGPQINQFYPPPFYPVHPQVVGTTGGMPRMGADAAGAQVYGGVSLQQPSGVRQQQYVADPGYQWYLQVRKRNRK